MRAEKQAKIEGVSIQELIEKNLPSPTKRKRVTGSRRVSFSAPEALIKKATKANEFSVSDLIVRALAVATAETSLSSHDYRLLSEMVTPV